MWPNPQFQVKSTEEIDNEKFGFFVQPHIFSKLWDYYLRLKIAAEHLETKIVVKDLNIECSLSFFCHRYRGKTALPE